MITTELLLEVALTVVSWALAHGGAMVRALVLWGLQGNQGLVTHQPMGALIPLTLWQRAFYNG